ncbi:TrmB family transcriptional regulator [Arenimonas sp.]|uniref:TrmB family transcriptional regulator n=1 Tax=Arenimonas sp. TaxID=1872635 RepID=UPI0035AE7654
MSTEPNPEQTLASLGFTELETRIYVALLRQSPQTGYGLSKALGKAPANIYQALASLSLKGAVLVEEAGGSRSASAVPPDELLEQLGRRFKASRDAAADALAKVHVPLPQNRLFQIQDVDQFYARAEALIDQAGETILFDLFPEPLRRLHPALQRAHLRGVRIAGLVYEEVDAPYPASLAARAGFALERWPGQQATVVADANEYVLGLIARDGACLVHGLWTDSPYLSCMQHSGLSAEIELGSLAHGEDGPAFAATSLLAAMPPGLRRLTGLPTHGDET